MLKQRSRVGAGCSRWHVHCTRRAVARSRVSHVGTSGCSGKVSILFIDSGLHLFEDMVDPAQVFSGLRVSHRWQAVGLDRIFLTIAATDRDRLVRRGGDGSWDDLRQLETLEFIQTTADVLKVNRVDFSALDCAEKVIQGIITPLASFEIV